MSINDALDVNWRYSPHIIVSGIALDETKSVCQRLVSSLGAAFGQDDVETHVVTPENAAVVLAEVKQFIEYRNDVLKDSRSKSVDEHNRYHTPTIPHIAVLIPEMSGVCRDSEAEYLLSIVTAWGRPVGVHVMMLTFYPEPSYRMIPAKIRANVLTHLHFKLT